MADEIGKISVIYNNKIGTWKLSKDLLVKLADNNKKMASMCKKQTSRYKLYMWLEENNTIENHTINEKMSIYIPKTFDDYRKIISTEPPFVSDSKKTIEYEQNEIHFNDVFLFKHKKQPGKDENGDTADDMTSKNLTVNDIIKKFPYFRPIFQNLLDLQQKEKYRNSELLRNKKKLEEYLKNNKIEQNKEFENIIKDSKQKMKTLLQHSSIGDWEKIAKIFFDKFCSGDDTNFEVSASSTGEKHLLYKLFTSHDATEKNIKDFKNRFEKYLQKYDFDIVSFDIDDFRNSIFGEYKSEKKGVSRPIFDSGLLGEQNLIGAVILFHDTHGFNVKAKEIKIINNKFSCKLCFEYYDHFGLDKNDIENHGQDLLGGEGFRAWYVLQHISDYNTNCKPFINIIKHEELVEFKIK